MQRIFNEVWGSGFGDLVLRIFFVYLLCFIPPRWISCVGRCFHLYASLLVCIFILTNPASWLPEPIKVLLASFTLYACRGCNQESPSRLALVFRVYRAMLCIRGTIAMGLCPSVCLSQVDVLSKRMNESSCFLVCEFPSTQPTLC